MALFVVAMALGGLTASWLAGGEPSQGDFAETGVAMVHVAGEGPSPRLNELLTAYGMDAQSPGPEEDGAVPRADASQPGAAVKLATAPQLLSEAAVRVIDRWAANGVHISGDAASLDVISLENIDAALSAIPEPVLKRLGNRDLGPLHIVVTREGRTMSGAQPYGGPANYFSTNEWRNEVVLHPQQSVFTIAHELGHAYNLRHTPAARYALVLLEDEMRSFIAAAGWVVESSEAEVLSAADHMSVRYRYEGEFTWQRLSNHDPLEDFANSFAMYVLDPIGLLAASPERHAWMAAHVGAVQ